MNEKEQNEEERAQKLLELLEAKDDFQKHFEFLDKFDEKIKELVGCDLDPEKCSRERMLKCACDMRRLNIGLLKKMKFYEEDFEKMLVSITEFIEAIVSTFNVENKKQEKRNVTFYS